MKASPAHPSGSANGAGGGAPPPDYQPSFLDPGAWRLSTRVFDVPSDPGRAAFRRQGPPVDRRAPVGGGTVGGLTGSPAFFVSDNALRDAVLHGSARPRHLLIGYDGSAGAKHAVKKAADLFSGARATVACVWYSYLDYVREHGAFPGMALVETPDTLLAEEKLAQRIAAEGTALACERGLDARPLVREGLPVHLTLDHLAGELRASMIIVGERPPGILHTLRAGVSRRLVAHATHPVLVFPTPAVREHSTPVPHRTHSPWRMGSCRDARLRDLLRPHGRTT